MNKVVIAGKEYKKTNVFDYYWLFAKKRQDLFFNRIESPQGPWTDDEILKKYRFTNAYRASDRVSQYLINSVLGDEHSRSVEDVFFRVLIFKIFNKISTWEALENKFGDISISSFSREEYSNFLSNRMLSGSKNYSAAYIMPSGKSSFGYPQKHENNLALIELMLSDSVPIKIADSLTMESVYRILLSYPSIGPFLAYQYVIDLNYSSITSFSENDFVVAGPGAIDGISKCFLGVKKKSYVDVIKYMVDHQDQNFSRLGLDFRDLWGRPLHLIDCQNIFCELSKYSRISHPHIAGASGRTRIKQRYIADHSQIEYRYPSSWGLRTV